MQRDNTDRLGQASAAHKVHSTAIPEIPPQTDGFAQTPPLQVNLRRVDGDHAVISEMTAGLLLHNIDRRYVDDRVIDIFVQLLRPSGK